MFFSQYQSHKTALQTIRVLLIHTNDIADRLNVSEEVPFSIVLINIEHLVRRLCDDQYTDLLKKERGRHMENESLIQNERINIKSYKEV